MNKILLNHKNLSEVLSIYGLLILAECFDSPVTRCRFTAAPSQLCEDDTFRSVAFEFEHEDYEMLLQRIVSLEIVGLGGKVTLTEHAEETITIDWCDLGGFIGDSGNFSKADKLEFVTTHHDVFKELASTDQNLFVLSVERDETNYLSNLSSMKKNYIDAGGTYDSSDNGFFAREFLLLVALQNLRSVMTRLIAEKRIEYNIVTQWTNPVGMFAGLVMDEQMNGWKRMEARVSEFGNYGLVLGGGKDITQTSASGGSR